MAKIKCLEDFKIWSHSRVLYSSIVKITNNSIFHSHLNLKNQMRSCALSIMANCAEGYARKGNREFLQFLSISQASLVELKSHIYCCFDTHLIDQSEFNQIIKQITEINKMLNSLIWYLKKSSLKGIKYK